MTEIQKRFITGRKRAKGRICACGARRRSAASSPIHDCFDWNDSEAAEKWRLNRRGSLCRRSRSD